MEHTAAMTMALIIEYFIFMMLVGNARQKTKIFPPAMSGDPFLEANLRVQQNTLEQIIVVVPAMWICSYYLSELFAVAMGGVFLIGRIMFCMGYRKAPEKRTAGFLIGWLATAALILAACCGVVSSLFF